MEVIIGDTFRLDIVKQALEAEGFTVLYIRNPHAVYAKLAPRIEMLFAQKRIIFGNNPLMRWNTNNIVVKVRSDGNKDFLKKDEVRRKTAALQPLSMPCGRPIIYCQRKNKSFS